MLFLVILVTFVLSYVLLLGIRQGTFKSDWYTLYNVNVAAARRFNDLRLLVNIAFKHPPGPKWTGGQEKVDIAIFILISIISTLIMSRPSH